MTENTAPTTTDADAMFTDEFEGADLDAETSVDGPTGEAFEEALVEASTPDNEKPVAEAAPSEGEKPAKVEGVRDRNAFEKGTWQAKIVESAILTDRSTMARKKAGALLWAGATEAIGEWEAKSDVDVHAEVLYADLLDLMGTSRKGDVSKIKKVALAVKNAGLVLDQFENLAKAYAEATRLIDTVKEQKSEDDAAETAVESITAPQSTTTAEGAAQILLSKGIDGAIVAILDALNGVSGEQNVAAHRAFARAVNVEVQSRVAASKPEKAPVASGPKAGATEVKGSPKATPAAKPAATKAKPAATKATPSAANARQTDPTKRALPPKATPAKATPVKR